VVVVNSGSGSGSSSRRRRRRRHGENLKELLLMSNVCACVWQNSVYISQFDVGRRDSNIRGRGQVINA